MNKLSYQQYLLIKLAEEALELSQIALKTVQYGYESTKSLTQLSNRELISQELDDVYAVLSELQKFSELNYQSDNERIRYKISKHRENITKVIKIND